MRLSQTMRWWRSAAVLTLVLAGSAQAQLTPDDQDILSESAARPRLVVLNNVYDIGHVLQLDRPEFDFNITNAGTGVLIVSHVQSTCGCTVPELSKKQFNPGESGTVHVKYDPTGKVGTQVKQVVIHSNDADRPQIPMTFKVDVAPVVIVEPRTLNLSQVPKGQPKTVVVKVIGRTPDFAATYATVAHGEYFTVKILDTKPVEMEGKTLRQTDIEVTLSPTAPVGRLTDNLSIRTTDAREGVAFCQITADVVGDIKAEPSVLPFGVVRSGESFKGSIKLATRSNSPFKILKAEVRQPNTAQLQLSFVPENPSNPSVYTVTAEGTAPVLAEGVRPTAIQGFIVISTDIDREGSIEIPFYIQPRLAPQTVPTRPPAPAPAK